MKRAMINFLRLGVSLFGEFHTVASSLKNESGVTKIAVGWIEKIKE